MIESVIVEYLSSALNVPVYMGEPDRSQVGTWVRVEKTGGGMQNFIYTATVAVQSYAPTFYEAAQLNHSVVSAMLDIADLPVVASINLNSDYNFTDTSTKQPRYQAVFELVHYEV